MREFIGNPNREEFYEEDDVESDVFFDGADEVIYLDPNDMGIEIDDDYDDDEGDEDFESLSFGDHFSSEEDEEDEYVDDEESLSDEVQELVTEEVDFEPNDRSTYHNKISDTDSDYTQSSEDYCTVIGESGDSSTS